MNFCKASLLSFLTVFLLSTTKILAVSEATYTQDEKASFFEGFSSEVITSFISLFSSSPDSDPVIKSSKTSDVSCYNFTMDIFTDDSPEGISWEVKNANTGEIIAGKEEGFYSEAEELSWYFHDDNETICLDMDNSDICYDVVVSDTSKDYYTSTFQLYYYDEYHNNNDVYSKWTDANETYTVCGFDDFDYEYGCLLPEHEPSCACDDVAYCILDDITSVFYFLLSSVFFIVFFPCIAVGFIVALPFTLVYAILFYSAMFGMTPWELFLYLFLGIGRS